MPIGNYRIRVTGLTELKRAVRDGGDPLIGEPMVHAMEFIGEIGQTAAEAAGPIGPTGRLVARLSHTVSSARPVPLWAKVVTSARQVSRQYPRGYPYPRRLEYDPRLHHLGWMRDAITRAKPAIEAALQAAAEEIKARFGSGMV